MESTAHQIGALNTVSRLNRSAEWMFTIKHAVNSGQIANRFSLFLSPPPSLGSHRCWQWWLWNEFSLNEGFSLNLNPAAWQETTMLSAFFGLNLFSPSPYSLSLLFSPPIMSVPHLFFSVSLSHVFVPEHNTNALRCDVAWAFFLWIPVWSPSSVIDDLLPHIALWAVLVCTQI